MTNMNCTETPPGKSSCWPWSHQWAKWADKSWSKLMRVRPAFVSATSTANDDEVGLECIQERRCSRCGLIQMRAERTRLP